MKKHLWILVITSLLACVALPARAEQILQLELTQGVQTKLPIAIADFSGEEDLGVNNQPSKVIMVDLLNSGEFNISSGKTLPSQPHSVRSVVLSQWRDLGVQDLIVGSVQAISDDRYRVALSLVSVYGDVTQAGGVAPSAVLFSQTYTVDKKDLRALGHKLSDKIYALLTGKKGVFSSKVAYVSVLPSREAKHPKFELVVADYDGHHPKTLVSSSEPIMSPAWSNDRRCLAFVSFKARRPALYKVNVFSGELTQLTAVGSVNGAPAWSPDGSTLAFASATTGVPKIYLLNLTTKEMTQLTKGISIDTEPSFSSDGRTLLFTSNRGGTPQIYQYNFANKAIERLTYSGDYNAKASTAGEYMVMLQGHDHQYNIAVQNLKTDEVTVVTDNGNDESPSWAPNGNLIIYATHLQGRPALAIVSRDGSVKINFPASQGDVNEPVWG